MIKYTENKWIIILFIFILIVEIIAIIISFEKRESVKLILLVCGFLICLPTFIAVSQQEILIDDNKITMKFGLPYLYKPKTMVWDNIDFVTRETTLGLVICCLATRCPVKPRTINISGIKNMDSLIVEIVKRARFASIDPKFLKIVEKYNE